MSACKIIILDPLPAFRGALRRALETDDRVHVVADLGDPAQVLAMAPKLAANALVFGTGGGDAAALCRQIMKAHPIPVILLAEDGQQSSRAIEEALGEGAVAALVKPRTGGDVVLSKEWQKLVREIIGMAEVRVVRGRASGQTGGAKTAKEPAQVPQDALSRAYKVLAIGCSTGGPQALHAVLSALDPRFPLPVLVVQHMAPGFITGLVDWLNSTIALKVRLATNGEALLPGHVYIAPDGAHLVTLPAGEKLLAGLSDAPEVGGFRPAATTLLASVARTAGPLGIGVLLTGMGSDGAAGLLSMKEAGALTIAQDEESSVVFGMAGVAVQMNAAQAVLPLDEIAPALNRLVPATT